MSADAGIVKCSKWECLKRGWKSRKVLQIPSNYLGVVFPFSFFGGEEYQIYIFMYIYRDTYMYVCLSLSCLPHDKIPADPMAFLSTVLFWSKRAACGGGHVYGEFLTATCVCGLLFRQIQMNLEAQNHHFWRCYFLEYLLLELYVFCASGLDPNCFWPSPDRFPLVSGCCDYSGQIGTSAKIIVHTTRDERSFHAATRL